MAADKRPTNKNSVKKTAAKRQPVKKAAVKQKVPDKEKPVKKNPPGRNKRRLVLVAGLIVLAFALGAIVSAIGSSGNDLASSSLESSADTDETSLSTSTTTASSTTEGSTTTSTTTPPSPIVVPEGELEVVPGGPIPEAAQCKGNEFIPNSLPSPEKYSSDSVSMKFESSDPDKMFKEYMEEQCGNPTLVENTIDGFCEGQIVIGVFNVCENNPWMTEYLSLLDELGPTAAFLLKVDGEWVVTTKFQHYAEMANTILMYYEVRGVEKLRSIRNWHLAGPQGDDLPRVVENDHQEGLPSLILVYTVKDVCPQEAGASVIGFNVNDKRFEIFKTECEPPAEPPCAECPPDTTTTVPDGRKSNVTSTIAPPPVTPSATTTPTTLPPGQTDGGDSGVGAPPPATTVAPNPTTAPPGSTPSTSSPPGPGTTVLGP